MKIEIMNSLKDFTNEQGVMFTSEEDAIGYYKGLVEIIEDLILKERNRIVDKLNGEFEWDVDEFEKVRRFLTTI